MNVSRYEIFVVTHHLSPRTGPSIAYSSEHAYVVVKLTDADGVVGWGETYRTPGIFDIVTEVAKSLIGRTDSLRALLRDVRWMAGGLNGGGFACSALSIALEDLRARQMGVSVAEMYGGAVRSRVQMYAASGGYIEGLHPSETWDDELARVRSLGFNALKLRIGGYSIAEEAPLLERLRSSVPEDFELMADGNAAYTFSEAIEVGHVLHDLGFLWYEEPMQQRSGYVGYARLNQRLDITLAGGEGLLTRIDAERLLAANGVDIVQPDPVICGGIGDGIFISEVAALHGIVTTPHTSNSAIGIAASLQIIASLPDRTRSPATLEPLLEVGVDDSPWRTRLLAEPLATEDGWVTVPSGPGLGIVVDEEALRHHAVATAEGSE